MRILYLRCRKLPSTERRTQARPPWLAPGRTEFNQDPIVLTHAPEICAEILSPSNTAAETGERSALYFECRRSRGLDLQRCFQTDRLSLNARSGTSSAAPSGAGTMAGDVFRGSIGFADSPRAQGRCPVRVRGTNIHRINGPDLNSMFVKCRNTVQVPN